MRVAALFSGEFALIVAVASLLAVPAACFVMRSACFVMRSRLDVFASRIELTGRRLRHDPSDGVAATGRAATAGIVDFSRTRNLFLTPSYVCVEAK